MRRSLLVVLVLLLTSSFAAADDYVRIDADSLVGGTLGVLPFYVTRQCPDPDTLLGSSNGFVMTSTGAATWTFDSFVADPITDSWWTLGGLIFTDKIDGTSPDSFLTGGAALPFGTPGMPVVTEQLYFTLNLNLGLGGGELCIDSAFIPPGGSWKFSGMTCGPGGGAARPLFVDKYLSDANHPICLTVVGEGPVCPDPLINVTPGDDMLEGSHCDGLGFQFGADAGEGATIAGWSVTSGPGTIDASGNYSAGAMATGTYGVVIEVENDCGNTDDYAFDLSFTNADPAYTNTGGEGTEIVAGLQYSYDFDATDADACDDLSWSINSQSAGAANAATINSDGLLQWQTVLADIGLSIDFQIQVTDGITKGAVTYDFSVSVLEPVCNPPTITSTPAGDLIEDSHCFASHQFSADPGTYGQDPATITGWAVISGPGSIDGTGLYSHSASQDLSQSVTIEVTNSCGETDDYVFTLTLTTAAPVFTNAVGAPTTVKVGDLYSYDFDADDADTCDVTTYMYATVAPPTPAFTPTMDANTGEFEWQTDATDVGNTYTFNIWALDDGESKTNTKYELTVEVTALVCTAPDINVTPAGDQVTDSHCAASFQFDADPGMLGEDPATIAGWAVTSGPGSIDGTGLYTVSNSTEGAWTVEIEVTNSCGETDQYSFGLTLTTADPVFTNAGDAPDTACAGILYSFDFDATDADTCDTVVFAANTGSPAPVNTRSINSSTGLFEWLPDASEIGQTFQFEVWANDEGLAPPKSDAMYLLEITVKSCVQEEPEITLDPSYFSFTKVQGGSEPAGEVINITNTGTGTLNWNLTNDSSWLVPTMASGTAPSAVTLNINAGNRPVGDYRDTVFVTGNAFNSPQFAIVDLEITEPAEEPVITLDPSSFSFSKVQGASEPAGEVLNVTNTGTGTLNWNLTNDSSWLVPTMTSGTAPSAVTLNISAGNRPVGDYRDTVFVSGNAANSPQFAIVDLKITPPPMPCIELSDSSFTFTSYECGPDPDPQYFDILNCGDVPISWEIIDQMLLPQGSVAFDPSFGDDDHYDVEITVDIECLPVGTHYDTACVVLVEPDKAPPGFQACIEIEVIITEPPEMNIAGEVIDDITSLAITGATVELYDFFPSSLLATTTTAGDGTFDFGPYTGDYIVRAYKNGYYQNWVNVTAPDEHVQVALTPTDTPPGSPYYVVLYCGSATFEDYPILPGDVIEAYDQAGNLCGQKFVTTLGSYDFMEVYLDLPETDGLDEGCDEGEAIVIKLNGYDMTPFLDAPVYWTAHLDRLEACFDGYIEKEICLHLDSAYNLISWNVDPDDDGVEDLFADIMHVVEVISGFEQGAMTYDPALTEFSTLWSTDHLHGYWVKTTDSITFCITGLPVSPATPIHLEDIWNLVSYLPTGPDSTPDALASIYADLDIAIGYDEGALTWDTDNEEQSNMRAMYPGFGYWLKVDGDMDLIYEPGPVAIPAVTDNTTIKANTLSHITPTRQWIDLYGANVTVDGASISSGTLVEAVSEDGIICGAFTVNASGKLGFMPVYGDDTQTGGISEGPASGESFHLVVDGVETKETFTWTSHTERVEIGALNSIGGHGGTLPSAYQLQQNYPNPFNPKTTISYDLGVDAHVTLTIYNILGEAVKVLVDEYQSANSDYTVVWDGTDQNGYVVSSGVYFYRLSADEFSETKKMMLMK